MRCLAVNSFALSHIRNRESASVFALARAVPPPIISYTARAGSLSANAPGTVVALRVSKDWAIKVSIRSTVSCSMFWTGVVGIPNKLLTALVKRCHAVSLDPEEMCEASMALNSVLV